MSTHDDSLDDMTEQLLDDTTMSDLLGGVTRPDVRGLEPIAALARAARAPGTSAETEIDDVLLDRLVLVATPDGAVRPRRLGRAAVVAAGVLVFSSGAVAAASNHLPPPVQAAVAEVASYVGLDVPRPSDGTVAPASNDVRPPPVSTSGPTPAVPSPSPSAPPAADARCDPLGPCAPVTANPLLPGSGRPVGANPGAPPLPGRTPLPPLTPAPPAVSPPVPGNAAPSERPESSPPPVATTSPDAPATSMPGLRAGARDGRPAAQP